jgi:hypothetical protein
MLFGFLGTLLGLLLSPYVSCFNRDMCFVDAACIHQTNKTLMQRGAVVILRSFYGSGQWRFA